MKILLRRLAGLIGALTIIIIIALAVARLSMPLLTGQRGTIEALVAQSIGRPVHIGAIDADWRGLWPRLRVQDVRLLDADGKSLLGFDRAYITPDVFGTLMSGRMKLEDLHVVGADIHIVREADGTMILRGLGPRPRAQVGVLRDISLRLRSSRVRWEDRRLGVDYQFGEVDVSLETLGDDNHLAADLSLPPELGRHLKVMAELRGPLREPAAWRGKAYLKVQDLQAAELPDSLRPGGVRGELTFEGWSVWRDGGLTSLVGSVEVDGASLAGGIVDGAEVDRLRARFRWQAQGRDWRLRTRALELTRAGRNWSADRAGVWYRAGRGGQTRLSGVFSHARIEDLLTLLPERDSTAGGLARKLAARAPRGALAGVRFSAKLRGSEIERFGARGRFHDFGIAATDEVPGISGADGLFSLTQDGGHLYLDTRGLVFEHPRLFADALPVDHLQGHVRWRRENGGLSIESPEFSLSNEDLKARGRLRLRFEEDNRHLDMRLLLGEGNVARVERYLPVKILKPKVYEWLERALVEGRLTAGEVILQGDPRHFPFRGREGVLEARLQVENGILDYRPGWPRAEDVVAEVVFRDQSLSVTSPHARVLASRVESAVIRVPDLREGQLRLEAQARGPLVDILTYLHSSDLVQPEDFKNLAVDGESRLNLDIRLPLSKRHPGERLVSGSVQVDGAGLRISPWNVAFDTINGRLSFGPDGFNGQAIDARLQGHKVTVDVARGADAGTDVSIRGRLPASALLKGFEHPLLARVTGESYWHAVVGLPAFKPPEEEAEPEPLSLSLVSMLEGTAIRLPEPLAKAAEERLRFNLTTAVGAGRQHPIRVQYGSKISAVLVLKEGTTGLRLERGELRVNRGQAALSNEGIFVKADLDEFSISDWRPWLTDAARTASAGADDAVALRELDVAVDSLEWSGKTFKDVQVVVRRIGERWLAEVDSDRVKGRIVMPLDLQSGSPLVADLEHLDLTTGEGPKPAAIDPRELPPLLLRSKQLRINDLEFTRVRLKATRLKDGLRVQILELAAPDFYGRAQGDWRVVANERQRSRFRFVLESGDVGSLLRSWDLLHSVRDGETHVEASLSWPGAPYRIDLENLKGYAQLRVEKGRLRELDPGAGRLLGLMNLNAIVRRLTLDFSDLFRTGFSFDTIKGDLRFDGGNLSTDNLFMKGPSAKIAIAGRAGLAARDLDLRVGVTPEIISGLPLAGALLGGPAIGAAIFVAEKIANELDEDLGDAAAIPYKVAGSWDNPEVDLIEAPAESPKSQKNFPHNIR